MELAPTSELHEDSSLPLFPFRNFVSELLAVLNLSKILLILWLGFIFC
jgi:hypothetical protein